MVIYGEFTGNLQGFTEIVVSRIITMIIEVLRISGDISVTEGIIIRFLW